MLYMVGLKNIFHIVDGGSHVVFGGSKEYI